MIRRRLLASVAAVAVAFSVMITAGPAATAETRSPSSSAPAGPEALISLDGVTFSQAPEGSLFDPDRKVVPGDVLTGTLWVRNASSDPAILTLAVTDQAGSQELLHALKVAYTPNEWLPVVAPSGQCDQMTIPESIDPGTQTRIDLSLMVDDALAGRTAQNSTGSFAVRAALSDPLAPIPDACDSGTVIPATPNAHGAIASTGAVVVGPLAAAVAAILIGILIGLRRRRPEGDAR